MNDTSLLAPRGASGRGAGARVALLVLLLVLLVGLLALDGPGEQAWTRRLYLPLHTALEIFAVVVAAMIFSIGWHSCDGAVARSVALLSPAFLAVALFDLGHLMSVPGMPGMGGAGTVEKGIHFWLAARAVGTLALLAAALLPQRDQARSQPSVAVLAGALALSACGYWLALARPDLIPRTFVPGQGLTPFKIWCELALTALSLAAALALVLRARRHDSAPLWHMAAAAAILAISGACFSLYRSADDLFNLLGHVYKAMAYLCLYRAIYVAAVREPYQRLRQSERSLAVSENRFRGLMECAPDAIVLADTTGRIAMMNARAEILFGLPRHVAAGMPVEALVPAPTPGDDDEVTCVRMHGGAFPAEVRRGNLETGAGPLDIAIVRDISERRRLEKALLDQLTHDALTGLPNRGRILEMLAEAMGAARKSGQGLAVLVLDIDHFKKINDGYGYSDGDAVLRECVARIGQELQADDTLARQGGNEFILVCRSAANLQQAADLAEALLARMRTPFLVRGQQVVLSASIGVTLMCSADSARAQELVHQAQVAMGVARQDGAGLYRFHTEEMERAIREKLALEGLLRHALGRDQLVLQYQPRVALASGEMVGVEALVRWRHPELGLVAPGRFIPLAEETGLIEEIDMWVLREACARAASWQAQGCSPVRVSVNLSARQFQQAGLARRVGAVLEQTGLAPRWLELEITEGTVMRDIGAAQAVLHSLKSIGVALAIDDFGTGYSSLGYLKRFPIDVLKIDRAFITDVTNDANDAAITRAVIALAHGLGLVAVAEGVETMDQLRFLKENGCDEIQGYYFSPPVWPEQLGKILECEKEYFKKAAFS